MTIDADDDILQDFLVEAGEILEQLGEQLVELEQRPDDTDLLNAVFRGFHTVKGGAGFLNLTSMVAVCHRAEDVFNVLRQGERHVDAELMDAVLRVLDIVNEQFAQISAGEEPAPADADLLAQLESLAKPGGGELAAAAAVVAPAESAEPVSEAPAGDGDITDQEFEALLDTIAADAPPGAASTGAADVSSSGDEISEDEFDALLDELHGKGQFKLPAVAAATDEAPAATGGDEISDDEFEALLGQSAFGNVTIKKRGTGFLIELRKTPTGPQPSSGRASSGSMIGTPSRMG